MRRAMRIASWTMLGVLWFFVLQQFFAVMAPRVAALLLHLPLANTPPCNAPDCDFSLYWPAGWLARAGRLSDLFTPATFLEWRHSLIFPGIQRLDWFYPPPILLPAMAISHLPFAAAYFVWVLVAALLAILLLRWAGLSWPVILAGLASPAALWNIEMGQVELFCAGCTIAGLMRLGDAPWRAGALLGLLLVKPQAGILAPIAALARGPWRAVLGGLVACGAIIGLITFRFGADIWHIFLRLAPNASWQVLGAARPIGAERGVSVLWMARSFGADFRLACMAQGLATLLAILAMIRIWRASRPRLLQVAMTCFLSLLAIPYGYVDDMVAYSIMLVALAEARGWRIDPLDVILILWPALCPIVVMKTGLLLTPLAVGVALLRASHPAGAKTWHLPDENPVLRRAP